MSIKILLGHAGLQSHSLDSKSVRAYLMSIFLPFETCLIENNYGALFVILLTVVLAPQLIIFISIYALYRTNKRIAEEKIQNRPLEIRQLVVFIQLNHIQSLIEKLDEYPELINGTYKNKTLNYWCKHYNNVNAHSAILKRLKKGHPIKDGLTRFNYLKKSMS